MEQVTWSNVFSPSDLSVTGFICDRLRLRVLDPGWEEPQKDMQESEKLARGLRAGPSLGRQRMLTVSGGLYPSGALSAYRISQMGPH